MNLSDMKEGLRYIVTHDSKNKEFQVGDRIRLENGDMLNITAGGFMEAKYLTEATEGMTVEVNKEWVERQRLKLQQQLAALES